MGIPSRALPPTIEALAARSDPGPLLGDYSVEDARDGIAVVDSRSGPQEVAPGDLSLGRGASCELRNGAAIGSS